MKQIHFHSLVVPVIRLALPFMRRCGLMLLVTGASASVNAAGIKTLYGDVPRVSSSLSPTGQLPAANQLSLAIGLPLRDQAGLSNLLQQIYDPTSVNYHHYLTPEQFAQQFGPTEQDYETVINFARTNGFAVVRTWGNRTLVDVKGPVADIERAFHVQIRTYQHPWEARQFYAPDVEPTLDASLPISFISGLNNYVLPRPLYHKKSSMDQSFATGSSPSGSYWGNDFRKAYAPGVTLTGKGQTVALFECDGYYTNDVSSYLNATSLPKVPLTNVLIDGFSGLPSGSGGEVEVALDIDMAISMAPGLSNIIVYEGPSDTPANDLDILNQIAMDNLAKQISSSWLIGDTAQYAPIYQQFAAQGQSFFQASGDEGAYYSGIFQYEDSPLVTLVGGTMLTSTGTGGVWTAETVWNSGGGNAGGGGISTVYTIPSYQTNISMTANQGSSTFRNVPDVALTANNIYIWGDGSPITSIGGTSCAAPLWAGFMALVNQQLVSSGQSPAGFINPAIYALAQTPAYPNLFHDITNGNNTTPSSPSKYFAVPGYDLCTGWGTPVGQSLINALAPPLIVTLPASATEGAGLLPGAGSIQLPVAQASNVVVALTSSDPTQVSVPSSVTVLAGQSNAVFNLTILDDGILDGAQTATITAIVPGVGSGSANMTIFDAETAVLQILLPNLVTKGQGAVQGTVQVSAPVGANVTVALTSGTTNLIQIPASVIVPTGQTTAVFTATVLTDGQINGGRTVNLAAHVQNWTDGTEAVTVQDNVNLTVALPASAYDNAGVLTNAGLVSMAGTSAVGHVISLTSGNISKLTVPANVTIPAGSLSNTFNITMVNSLVPTNNQTVTVTASAPGFTNGVASMLVLDALSPPIPTAPSPGNFATNVLANTNLMWSSGSTGNSNQLILNGGFETGTFTNWVVTNSTTAGNWVINNGAYVPPGPGGATLPYAGGYSALSEQTGQGTHTLYQDITVPSGASSVVLSWADEIRNFGTQFATNTQYYDVEIRRTNNTLLQIAFITAPGEPLTTNWVARSVNVSAYVGQTIRIAFVESDSLGYFNVGVDNVSVVANTPGAGLAGVITNNVYFGTNPTPGPAQLLGSTTNNLWTLPLLAPQTTYYWQIVANRVGTTAGPIWQFTTAGVDHFAWSTIPTPQLVNQPFSATITAKDAFNTTVTNFTGPVSLAAAGAGSATTLLEGFESGVWPHSPWVSVTGVTLGSISQAYAHDGNYGLSDPEWFYRTDVTIGKSGDNLSWWVRPSTTTGGRAYLGFGASSSGCWSIIAAPNTSQFIIDQDSSYGFVTVASTTQTWQANRWYRVAVQFNSPTSITCSLFDTNGTTLLNSLSYTNGTSLAGGIAMRSFGTFSLDTITSGGLGGNSPNVSITPTNSGIFANGTWSGSIAVQQPATNIVLAANDGNNHTGNSNPFNVNLTNDISISMAASPNPVSTGASLTYTLTVANSGPASATSVVVTNILPANIAFVSATSSQGSCAQSNGVVVCSLGIVPGGTNATIAIIVTPLLAGTTLTNTATVSRAEPDSYLGNNTATAVTPVTGPAISIADAAVVEGTVGTTNMNFAVSLTGPSGQTVSVNYTTSDGTAVAGTDYVATSGTLTFLPGVTNRAIPVTVNGNILLASNIFFYVNLSNPINGVLGRSQGTGTISGPVSMAPIILSQPTGQSAVIGGGAQFAVTAYGTAPLAYQWSFNNTNLVNATNATLTLTSVQPINAGNYSVLVTNLYGSTNSVAVALTILPAPPCDPVPSGITAWWQAESNTLDSIGANNGSPVGNLTYTNGEVGQAFVFDGSTSYIPLPASPSLDIGASGSGLTIECWIKPSPNVNAPIIEWDSSSTTGVEFWDSNGNTQFLFSIVDTSGNQQTITFPYLFDTNNFQHVAATYDKSSGLVVLYINGTNVASANFGTMTPQTTYPVNIGRRTGEPIGLNDTYGGLMDELSLYNRALSSNEIAAIYLAGSEGKCQSSLLAPVITAQPTNLTVVVSNTAVFSVTATGTAPLSYQWSFNNTNLLGATNATLTLPSVQLAQAGNYSVLVTNLYGSTNSATAVLTVLVPSCDPPPSGIVAWWPGQGNASDIIGGNSGTLVNGTTFTNGEVGTAFSLNGANNFVLVNPAAPANLNVGSNGLTFEEWIKPNNVTSEELLMEYERALATGSGSDVGIGLAIHADLGGILYANLTDTIGVNHIFASPAGILAAGVWQHVALTYDRASGLAALYINGVTVTLTNVGTFMPQTSFTNLLLGARTTFNSVAGPGAVYSGALDEISLYNRALSSNEIAAIYLAGSEGKCTPLLLAPVITNQPAGQRVSIGCDVAFGVGASGTPPLTYQWWKVPSALIGQTNTSLILNNVQSNDFASYFVVVANSFGSATSSIAVLALDHAPVAAQDIMQRSANGDGKVQVAALLTNDTDADGDKLIFVGVSSNSVAGGTVYWSGNWVYYQAPAGYTNSDAFTYTISDGHCGGTATGNVLVQVLTPIGPSHNFTITALPGGSVLLQFAGIPGWTYRIQYTTLLTPANWIDLSTNTADASGMYQYIDTPPISFPSTNPPSRFYRSVSP